MNALIYWANYLQAKLQSSDAYLAGWYCVSLGAIASIQSLERGEGGKHN